MALSTVKKSQASAMNAFSKASDLKKRIVFTILALVVFRFGSFIPLPGINMDVISSFFNSGPNNGFIDMFNTFAGGALERMSILALNIMPYISASIVIQMAGAIFKPLGALRKEGEAGMRKMNQYTRYLTIFITIIQGYGLAVALQNMADGTAVILSSSLLFKLTTIVSLLGGTLFVIWLGEQITNRGIGNGTSLIIAIGILAELPKFFFETLTNQALASSTVLIILAMSFLLIYLVVFVERAQRRIVIQYSKGMTMGGRAMAMNNSYFPLKINMSGVKPPIFASALLMLPLTILQFLANSEVGQSGFASSMRIWLERGGALYMTLYAALIFFFTFFQTSLVFNPMETAENLKKNGGFIAGRRPGKSPADYLDYVVTRLTFLGAIYLVFLCIVPELLTAELGIRFVLGGTSLLIVVTVIMETISQVQSHLVAYQYEGLIRKAQLKGKL